MSARPVIPLYPPNAASPEELHRRAADEALRWSEQVSQGVGIRFPWTAVDRLVDELMPGWLVLVGGRAKGGKSTLLRELFGFWVTECKKRICYVGTEQSAAILRMLWAALRIGAPVEAAFKPSHPQHSRVLYDVVHTQADCATEGIIVAEPALTLELFVQWARYAYSQHCDVLMLDHFHRLAVDGRHRWQGRGDAIQDIKNIAAKSNMLVVAAAQMKDGEGDSLGQYEVPGSNSWAETSELRRECDVAVQVWRPFKTVVETVTSDGEVRRSKVTREMKQAAREDPQALARIVERNTMALRVDAHRYRDEPGTRAARLFVSDGQISSWSGAAPAGSPSERGDARED